MAGRKASVTGNRHLPSVPRTLADLIIESVTRAPAQREAIVFRDRVWTYTQLAACVFRLAQHLIALSARGDRVTILLPNGPEIVIAAFAAHVAGAQASLTNPNYTERELDPILADAQPLLVITDATRAEKHGGSISRHSRLPPILVGAAGEDIASDGPNPGPPSSLPAPGDLALLQYTGGTTGRSKGVVLTHASMCLNIAQRAAHLPGRMGEDRLLCATPLFHAYATASVLYPSALWQSTMVILPQYKPDLVLQAIDRQRITVFPGLPTIYAGLLSHPDVPKTDFSSLRLCISGAAPLPVQVLEKWDAAVGVPICEGYGLTEACAVLTYNPADGVRKVGSVGPPLPGTKIEIVDLETGTRLLDVGEQGEVRAVGAQLMQGYRNLPEETSETIRDGWLYTGDIGEIDADGYLFIRDRKKEMALVGGYNVFPREIEEVLHAHPAVAEAVACGVPDCYKGEVINAFVRLKVGASADAASLITHCKANLVHYKVPTVIELLDEIPKTAAGKTDRKALRAIAVAKVAQK